MTIHYDIRPEDITYYSKENAKGKPLYYLQVAIMMVVALLFLGSDIILAAVSTIENDGSIKLSSMHRVPRTIIFFAIMGVTYFGTVFISKRAMRKANAKAGPNGIFCNHTLEITEEGFTETTHVNRSFHAWAGVDKLSESDNYLALYIRLNSGHIIPKRCFAKTEEMSAFIAEVGKYLPDGSHPPPPPKNIMDY
jgi:hypothetical protein